MEIIETPSDLNTSPDGHWQGDDHQDVGEEGDQSTANSTILRTRK